MTDIVYADGTVRHVFSPPTPTQVVTTPVKPSPVVRVLNGFEQARWPILMTVLAVFWTGHDRLSVLRALDHAMMFLLAGVMRRGMPTVLFGDKAHR